MAHSGGAGGGTEGILWEQCSRDPIFSHVWERGEGRGEKQSPVWGEVHMSGPGAGGAEVGERAARSRKPEQD